MNSLIHYNNSNLILRKPVNYITIEEAEALKRACDTIYERTANHTENDAWIKDRDKLLLTVLWVTGGRITDVLNISSSRIDFKNKTVNFLVKKRRDKDSIDKKFWHTISLDIETLSEIMDYLQKWSIKGLLFPSYRHSGKPLTRQAVSLKLKILSKTAGLRHIHCHLYRHGLAMFMQGQGIPAEMIAFRLAHSSTQVTLSIYARMDASQERKMIESLGVRLR